MGTNFYTLNRKKHIGKRSAHGIWCWDCKVKAKALLNGPASNQHVVTTCPKCGKFTRELSYNPSMVELGFNNPVSFSKKKGVDGASSFLWQTGDTGLGRTIFEIKKKLKQERQIEEESGERLCVPKFLKILDNVIEEKTCEAEFS